MRWTAGTVAAVGVGVAAAGYAIWAQESTPPQFPAQQLIDLQAVWNDGHYGVKFTFLSTVMTMAGLVGLLALPAAVVGRLVKMVRREGGTTVSLPAGEPGWATLLRRPAALSYAGAVIGLGLPYLWILNNSPERLIDAGGPGGIVGILLLMLAPLAAVAGESSPWADPRPVGGRGRHRGARRRAHRRAHDRGRPSAATAGPGGVATSCRRYRKDDRRPEEAVS